MQIRIFVCVTVPFLPPPVMRNSAFPLSAAGQPQQYPPVFCLPPDDVPYFDKQCLIDIKRVIFNQVCVTLISDSHRSCHADLHAAPDPNETAIFPAPFPSFPTV